MGGLLRLADSDEQSQITQGAPEGTPKSCLDLLLYFLFVFFLALEAGDGRFWPLIFLGALAATISYDCRIESLSSFQLKASNRSSITHL
jgi:hypothetical protein